MAFTLSTSKVQSNDATYLTVTDTVGEYNVTTNPDGWEGGSNPNYTDIVASTDTTTASSYHLKLTISVKDKSGTETSYDAINLYDLNSTGPFAAASELTWNIDASDLLSSGTAMGTSSDTLTDGVYTIKYALYDNITDQEQTSTSEIVYILVDGDAEIKVYDSLRDISTQYDNELNDESREIMESLLKYSYLKSIQYADPESESTKICNMLYNLNRLNSNYSKYSW